MQKLTGGGQGKWSMPKPNGEQWRQVMGSKHEWWGSKCKLRVVETSGWHQRLLVVGRVEWWAVASSDGCQSQIVGA